VSSLAGRLQLMPTFAAIAADVHHGYLRFLPLAEQLGLRALCANVARATVHTRDEAVERVVAASAALAADAVPALVALRDVGLVAKVELAVAALDQGCPPPANLEHVLATVARCSPVLVWPRSSPMAGVVRSWLEYAAAHGDDVLPEPCTWALVDPGPDEASRCNAAGASPEERLACILHEYGVVAVRRSCFEDGDEVPLADAAAASAAGPPARALRRLIASWYDGGTFRIPDAIGSTAVRTLALGFVLQDDLTCSDVHDTVFCPDIPSGAIVHHAIGTSQNPHARCDVPHRSRLRTVDLAACTSLREIDESAFFTCETLQSIVLPPSLEVIGPSAFAGCSSLVHVDASRCVELAEVKGNAFGSCPRLVSVDFGACTSLRVIGQMAFAVCTALESIRLPHSIKIIEHFAFAQCSQLVSIDLRACASLEKIGEYTFDDCQHLAAVLLPPSFDAPYSAPFFKRAGVEQLRGRVRW